MLLTCTERDFLLGNREFTKAQKRYLRCRLNKKVKEFVSNELTILQDKGYLVGTVAASSNGGFSLVRILPQTWHYHENSDYNNKENSGPGAIWTLDPRHVKAVS